VPLVVGTGAKALMTCAHAKRGKLGKGSLEIVGDFRVFFFCFEVPMAMVIQIIVKN